MINKVLVIPGVLLMTGMVLAADTKEQAAEPANLLSYQGSIESITLQGFIQSNGKARRCEDISS